MAQFITNKNNSFLNYIKEELNSCESFLFSVSFIKRAGLELFEKELVAALERGVSGQIITSTYQNFTDVVSLEKFLMWQKMYPAFSCRVDTIPLGDRGFHTKGYVFQHGATYHTLIGSTNITSFALLRNVEWNARIISNLPDKFIVDVLREFDTLWADSRALNQSLIDEYRLTLEYDYNQWDMDFFTTFNRIDPNYMQRKALYELSRYRGLGVTKALIVAATGSGKTYLSSFDARNFGAEKLLFVVHRETILKDALDTFRKVFGNTRTYGMYTGSQKDVDADFLFATNIMLSTTLERFDKDAFDYIVLDECHHATSATYQKIMQYFTPKFYLGLTATPERMDNEDVFALFDKNVPYELRLREALENDLIVPFKYFGIRDTYVDYGSSNKNLLREMTSPYHINFLAEHIEKHRPKDKLKALVFCRSVEHAEQMSRAFNGLGYHSGFLVGKHDANARRLAFMNLQNDNHPLELLFSVDLLNEGVDLPAVNMVLFLRPTESSTIFIQQLGRGLRKFKNKEYLTVLDFIGNSYERSVQIAIALGTLSKSTIVEKQLLKDYIRDDFKSLNLPIEIHLDPISKEEILHYVEKTNFNRFDFLKQDYLNFKKIIGAKDYVDHVDYVNNEYAPDLVRFIKQSLKNEEAGYYTFLKKMEEPVPDLDPLQLQLLKRLSSMLPLVRPYEFAIIKELIENGAMNIKDIKANIQSHWLIDEKHFAHSVDYLQNKFFSTNEQLTLPPIIEKDGNTLRIVQDVSAYRFKAFLVDLITYGLERHLTEFGNQRIGFGLFKPYSMEQILMMARQSATRYYRGTLFAADSVTYIFASLKKGLDDDHHLNYKDTFIDDQTFQWESETSTTMTNATGRKVKNTKVAHLFIRREKTENGMTLPYIYIGTGKFKNIRPSDNPKNTLLVDITLDEKIPENLHYDFQIEKEKKSTLH